MDQVDEPLHLSFSIGEPWKDQKVGPKYYDALARYYLSYLRAYETHGIFIDYLSLFNEPGIHTSVSYEDIRDLLKNHVHFIAVPMEPYSLAKTFNTLHMRYSQYVNMRNKAAGHLWQGRFFSCLLDERHLYAGLRYVENNPVRAQIVKRAEEYRWSSARERGKVSDRSVLSQDCHLFSSQGNLIKKYIIEIKPKAQTTLPIKGRKKNVYNGL
jgi:hypothetical protein